MFPKIRAWYVQGTEQTSEHLNIFLEYVPGGSIASLLGKFGEPHQTVPETQPWRSAE